MCRIWYVCYKERWEDNAFWRNCRSYFTLESKRRTLLLERNSVFIFWTLRIIILIPKRTAIATIMENKIILVPSCRVWFTNEEISLSKESASKSPINMKIIKEENLELRLDIEIPDVIKVLKELDVYKSTSWYFAKRLSLYNLTSRVCSTSY